MTVRKKFMLFVLAGGTGALTELLIFNLSFLVFNFAISKLISLVFAISLNFSMNRNITFKMKSGKISKQLVRYLIVYSIAISFNYSVSLLMSAILPQTTLWANVATASGIVAAIPITFLGSLFWVFKK